MQASDLDAKDVAAVHEEIGPLMVHDVALWEPRVDGAELHEPRALDFLLLDSLVEVGCVERTHRCVDV